MTAKLIVTFEMTDKGLAVECKVNCEPGKIHREEIMRAVSLGEAVGKVLLEEHGAQFVHYKKEDAVISDLTSSRNSIH
ncbi:MAG: hypothetical protein ACRC9O_09515 [Plesiomonas sp.]|uniref:hypothetical protein n=1 Tax=Plesiomonas sp. TaxID=2486279 RepID=UPI003F308FEF